MMRKPWGGLCAAILLVGLVSQVGMSAPDPTSEATSVRLLSVTPTETASGTALELQASGPFGFTSYQPHARSVIVDLAGVVSPPAGGEKAGAVGWLDTYRLLPFRNAAGRRVLRLDLSLARDCSLEITQPGAETLLLVCPGAVEKAPRAPAVAAAPVPPAPKASAPAPTAVARRAPTAAAEGPVEVQQVDVRRERNQVVIEVQAAAPLGYEVQTLANPTRLVVDLPESILVSRRRQFAVDQEDVVGVRVGQFKAEPPVTRLVIDLLSMVPYEINSTPGGLRLTLGAPGKAELAEPDPTPEPVVAENQPEVEPAPQQEEATLLASLAPMVPSVVVSSASAAATVDNSPADSTEPLAEAVPAEPPTVKPETTPHTHAIPIEPAPMVQAEAAKPHFTGEPISVNLKDLDLKDFFRLIHEISGLNIIVDPQISGTVTMVLIDVPWDQALDIVLKNNGLGSQLEGNVLRIARLDTLKREQEEQRELAQARAEAVDPVTVTRTLSYAKASDLEQTLRRFLSSRGEIIRDDRTNTLIIRDIPQVIPEVDNLIQQIDRKSLQVEIEARVVSASRAFSREIGTQLATAFSTTGGRSIYGGALGPSSLNMGAAGTSVPPPPLVSTEGEGEGTLPLVTDLAATAATSGFLFGHRSPNFALDVILTAAESRNIAKILSKPRLVTQNNITGEVKQGTRIPVQTVVNNTISTQFIDVVLRLNVTPQITAEGTVFLNIIIENTQIDAGVERINGIPALATQSTTTQVLIPDGGTVVVGGVMVTSNTTNVAQVPLLGSIPVIGHLFKRTRVNTSTQELLFFITPRILPS